MYWPKVTLSTPEKVTVSDEQIKCALQSWKLASITKATDRVSLLWKFLIGFSVITMTGVAFLSDKTDPSLFNVLGLFSALGLVFLCISVVIGIVGSWPLLLNISCTTDILAKFNDSMSTHRKMTLLWFATWLLGVVFGFYVG